MNNARNLIKQSHQCTSVCDFLWAEKGRLWHSFTLQYCGGSVLPGDITLKQSSHSQSKDEQFQSFPLSFPAFETGIIL